MLLLLVYHPQRLPDSHPDLTKVRGQVNLGSVEPPCEGTRSAAMAHCLAIEVRPGRHLVYPLVCGRSNCPAVCCIRGVTVLASAISGAGYPCAGPLYS